MSRKNVFGKDKWRSTRTAEGALNAGVCRNVSITSNQQDSYGPFVRFHFENRSAEEIQIDLDGGAQSSGTVSNPQQTFFVPAGNILDITPYENGEPDYVFSFVCMKNLDGANNTAAGELVTSFGNY